MASGTIKDIRDRGFGFITPDGGGEDVFFHATGLVDVPLDELRPGDRVTYSTEADTRGKGPRAVDVRRETDAGGT